MNNREVSIHLLFASFFLFGSGVWLTLFIVYEVFISFAMFFAYLGLGVINLLEAYFGVVKGGKSISRN